MPELNRISIPTDTIDGFVSNPVHGGKVTCHKCNGSILQSEHLPYWDYQHGNEYPSIHFHKGCYNQYEHYYGLDRPIDYKV